MTQPTKPVVDPAELTLDHWQEGTFFESRDASFGAQLGLRDLGVSYGEVPAGKSGCPFHNHRVEEEMFVILSGEGEYRFGADRYAVRAGDVLGALGFGQCQGRHRRISPVRQVPGKIAHGGWRTGFPLHLPARHRH